MVYAIRWNYSGVLKFYWLDMMTGTSQSRELDEYDIIATLIPVGSIFSLSATSVGRHLHTTPAKSTAKPAPHPHPHPAKPQAHPPPPSALSDLAAHLNSELAHQAAVNANLTAQLAAMRHDLHTLATRMGAVEANAGLLDSLVVSPPPPPPSPPHPSPPPNVFTCCNGEETCGGAVNDPNICGILSGLYYYTGGTNWCLETAGWASAAGGSPTDYCTLAGCLCSGSGSLTGLEFGSNCMQGTIPSSLGSIASLKMLDLWGNSFTGSLPASIGRLSLAYLYLYDMVGPGLTGTIPTDLSSLTQLWDAKLAGSGLCGTIPWPAQASDGPLPPC